MATAEYYEIKVRGHLDKAWKHWFENISMVDLADGTTCLAGFLDQAALHGLLNKISNLGLPLISVTSSLNNQPAP